MIIVLYGDSRYETLGWELLGSVSDNLWYRPEIVEVAWGEAGLGYGNIEYRLEKTLRFHNGCCCWGF